MPSAFIALLIGGLVGGIIRSCVGLWKYGKPPKISGKTRLVWAFLLPGIIGMQAAFSVSETFIGTAGLDVWKIVVISAMAGYVGADIVNSFYKIFLKKGIRI
jgi:hypothetical protein